jgi:SAM-dependent methyltransferase
VGADSAEDGIDKVKSELIVQKIKSIKINEQVEEDELRRRLLQMVDSTSVVLDCGKSLREFHHQVKDKVKLLHTIDINKFSDYPDYLIDICDRRKMKKLRRKYDFIASFSLLEHCYDPISASANLFDSLKPGGVLIGSAPFLFPRHSPDDLSYQDFFRFTRDAYVILFPNASSIELWPMRGRVGTALNVLSTRYRFLFEEKFPILARHLNKFGSEDRQSLQSSGYGFLIKN